LHIAGIGCAGVVGLLDGESLFVSGCQGEIRGNQTACCVICGFGDDEDEDEDDDDGRGD